MNVSYKCNRKFNHKNSLRRHKNKRQNPCKPLIIECKNCVKRFSGIHSLKKHEKLYCKNRLQTFPCLQDCIEQGGELSTPLEADAPTLIIPKHETMCTPVYSTFKSELAGVEEQKNPYFSDSIHALFDTIRFSPDPEIQQQPPLPAPTQENSDILHTFDDILTSWLREVQRLEGVYISDAAIKKNVSSILSRMLQDGLLSERDYEDLTYTSTLFMQLHDLICMYNPTLNKRKVIELLIKLYDMRRISKSVLIEICVKL